MREIKGEVQVNEIEGLLSKPEWEQGKRPKIFYDIFFNAYESVDKIQGADRKLIFIIDGELYRGNMDSYNLGKEDYWVKVDYRMYPEKKPKNIKCYKYG